MPKEKTPDKKKPMSYVAPEMPAIAYADCVKVSTSTNGVLFSFGQTHPDRDGITVTYEVLLPVTVSLSLRNILVEQLAVLEQHLAKQLESHEE